MTKPAADAPIPFEALPGLAASDVFIRKAERLRELKAIQDECFRKPDLEKNDPGGEYEILKTELAAMALVHGAVSVAYIDLRITSAQGSIRKGVLSGAAIIEQYEAAGTPIDPQKLRAIALAAKDCDPKAAMQGGISPTVIEAARAPSKEIAGSVRVEWIGRSKSPAAADPQAN